MLGIKKVWVGGSAELVGVSRAVLGFRAQG